ncbi:hypothetical protein ES319_D09G053100v1 [Gossypium barbadense]|uniref:Uncharacterized protein n=2 Tax=Gossypium TaxID=3633 RepID=A0A0D2NMJ8_GOSRA|nr:hypothetical protein ES319_D09G053100v1 [Gossypium barbadense]KJB34372.1 hypothetical protein B456_006G063100 [Gossypium raimondii]
MNVSASITHIAIIRPKAESLHFCINFFHTLHSLIIHCPSLSQGHPTLAADERQQNCKNTNEFAIET